MKVIDYIILIDKELRELVENVHQHIKDDYIPLGGIVINETYSGKEFLQTMIKCEEIKQNQEEKGTRFSWFSEAFKGEK